MPEISKLTRLLSFKLFKRMVDQFDRLMKRKAFLDQYKKEKWFADGLGEFDEARCVPSLYLIII